MTLTDQQKQDIVNATAAILQTNLALQPQELTFKTALIARFVISLGSANIDNLQKGVEALAHQGGYSQDENDPSLQMDIALKELITGVDRTVRDYQRSRAVRQAAEQKEQEFQDFSTIAE